MLVVLREELAATHPTLIVDVRDKQLLVHGTYRLMEGDTEIDRYQILLKFPPDYPDREPTLFEVGGRIPHCAKYHMYSSGRACLYVPGERWRYWPKGSSFTAFLDGPVRAFFIGQSLVEEGQPWPFGERAHGASGVLEAYMEMVESTHPRETVRYIQALARPILRENRSCPCASGRPVADCHREQLVLLRERISRAEAEQALALIQRDKPELCGSGTYIKPRISRIPVPRRR